MKKTKQSLNIYKDAITKCLCFSEWGPVFVAPSKLIISTFLSPNLTRGLDKHKGPHTYFEFVSNGKHCALNIVSRRLAWIQNAYHPHLTNHLRKSVTFSGYCSEKATYIILERLWLCVRCILLMLMTFFSFI